MRCIDEEQRSASISQWVTHVEEMAFNIGDDDDEAIEALAMYAAAEQHYAMGAAHVFTTSVASITSLVECAGRRVG